VKHSSLSLGKKDADACIDPHDCPPFTTIDGSGIPSWQNVQGSVMGSDGQQIFSNPCIVAHIEDNPSTAFAISFCEAQVSPCLPGISNPTSIMPSSQNVQKSDRKSGVG
jgi:hypothetical protein